MANTGPQAQQAQVSFDLAALRQPASLAARNVLADNDIPLSGGSLEVSLGPLEHVVVWLKPR